MKLPRLRLSWLMFGVVLVSIIVDAFSDPEMGDNNQCGRDGGCSDNPSGTVDPTWLGLPLLAKSKGRPSESYRSTDSDGNATLVIHLPRKKAV
jgi:hypothetical protein